MNVSNNFEQPDEFYDCLLAAHADLSAQDSARLNARLVLLLANQIGSADLLAQCIEAARQAEAR